MYLENLINKIKLPFRKDKELYRRLYTILGFYPKDISLYKQALLHKSLSIKGKDGRSKNNERLEFLGDAILDAIVGDIVYRHFQGKHEGFLTNTRSKIVQRETLGKLAVEIGIDKLIQYNGQNQSPHSYMAGNAFEAIVGAIYLDYGYARCMDFMKQRILSSIINIDKVAYQEVNFKSKLLEWSQKNRIRIVYDDSEQRKANGNSSTFYSEVVIEDIVCGSGKGYSKKEAQQNASKDALYKLKKQKGFEQSIFDAKGKRTAMEEQPQALLPEIPDDLLKPARDERPEKKAERPAEKKTEKRVEKKAEKTAEKKQEKPAEKKAEKPAEKKAEKPAEKKAEKPAVEDKGEKPAEKRVRRSTEKKAEKPARSPKAENPAEQDIEAPQVESPEQTESSEEPAKRKPHRRRAHKPKTTLKPNAETPSSENV